MHFTTGHRPLAAIIFFENHFGEPAKNVQGSQMTKGSCKLPHCLKGSKKGIKNIQLFKSMSHF